MTGLMLAFILTIVLMVLVFAAITIYCIIRPDFAWLLPFVPLGIFLVLPVFRAVNDERYRAGFVYTIHVRAIALAAGMLAAFTFGCFTGWF